MSDDASTPSKSEPVRAPRDRRSSLSQRWSGTPVRNQGEPLSATITPLVCMAWAVAELREVASHRPTT